MIHHGRTLRTEASTWTELVAALIHGYGDHLDRTEAAAMRLRYAADIQVPLQAHLLYGADLSALSNDERATVLAERHVPPTPRRWDAPVPLVLVTSFYEPDGKLARPGGDGTIVWLDPADDQTLVTSLAAAGYVEVVT